jgi:hypothetical protein
MRRREFIKVVGGAATIWPLGARAQQAKPAVGYLHSAGPSVNTQQLPRSSKD